MNYVVHIGLEIHIHLSTASKMFCSCRAHFGDTANTNICPVCMGLPGTLPLPNKEAIVQALQIVQVLQCTLASHVQFDRKNYFYPDMPKNYQISQYFNPLGQGGVFQFYHEGKTKDIGIREMHIEEDAGKLIHTDDESYIDYNRAGHPLVEIVTKPELRSPRETEVMAQQLHKTMQYLAVCDGNMEEGSFRCDANISLSTKEDELGAKVEIKNLNSFHFIKRALQFEIERQTKLCNAGEPVKQETRLWNENKDRTEGMRGKEDVHDYRYLKEPDIPSSMLLPELGREAKERTTVLPVQRLVELIETHRLDEQSAWLLVENRGLGDTFYGLLNDEANPRVLARWITGELRTSLRKLGMELSESSITVEHLKEFFQVLHEGSVSERKAKQLMQIMTQSGESPRAILEREGWILITDEKRITAYANEVCSKHSAIVAQVRGGEAKSFDFLMGSLMQLSKGQVQPQRGREILEKVVYDDA